MIDLSADLGEGEAPARTRSLMRYLTSANIACGGHAGELKSMSRCVRLAVQENVRIGAHPGDWSRQSFGRGPVSLGAEELSLLLVHQIAALQAIANLEGAQLHHVKLHGTLYHLTEQDAPVRNSYIRTIRDYFPDLVIFCRSNGKVQLAAERAGLTVWPEAFADRGYMPDGNLVDRALPGALLDSERALEQARSILCGGRVEARDGAKIAIQAKTLCVHSDSLDSAKIARRIRNLINKG